MSTKKTPKKKMSNTDNANTMRSSAYYFSLFEQVGSSSDGPKMHIHKSSFEEPASC